MVKDAFISYCGMYRYYLSREWDDMFTKAKIAMFIGLNPSTADAENDDPTIRRCIDFTKRMDCNYLLMVNLFAFRATEPKEMKKAVNPIGEMNDSTLYNLAKKAGKIIICWGKDGSFKDRDKEVLEILKEFDMHTLKINKDGSPAHPLYLKKDCELTLFNKTATI